MYKGPLHKTCHPHTALICYSQLARWSCATACWPSSYVLQPAGPLVMCYSLHDTLMAIHLQARLDELRLAVQQKDDLYLALEVELQEAK